MERHSQQTTCHHERLSQIWHLHKIHIQPFHPHSIFSQHDFLTSMLGADTQSFKNLCTSTVTLQTFCEQTRQQNFSISVSRKCHHLIPVACSTPIALHHVRGGLITGGFHHDCTAIFPPCFRPITAHDSQSHINIWATYNIVYQIQYQSILQHRTNHQQRRNILRADTSR